MINHYKKTKTEYRDYIELATVGHYPLFFSEWLLQSIQSYPHGQKLTFKKAGINVKKTFEQLARHHSVEKKKTALICMEQTSREEFIRSFLKIVEHETARRMTELQ